MPQTTFDFKWATRQRILESVKLPPACLNGKSTLLLRMTLLLKTIDSFSGDGGRCFASMETIAARMRCHTRSVQRVLSIAKKLDLVRQTIRGRTQTAYLDLNWSLIVEWSSESPHEQVTTNNVSTDRTVLSPVTGQLVQSDRTVLSPIAELPPVELKEDLSLCDAFDCTPLEDTYGFYQNFGQNDQTTLTPEIQMKTKSTKSTWLTPYADTWKEVLGGNMACEKAARAFKRLEDDFGRDETIRRWRIYCECHKGQSRYANAEKFSQTFGDWIDNPNRKYDAYGQELLLPGEKQQVYDPNDPDYVWSPETGLQRRSVAR